MRGMWRRLLVAMPWLVVAIVSCGVTSIAMMPAAWITPQFAKATQGHVNLVDPSGSLWHGSATLVLAAGGGGGQPLLPRARLISPAPCLIWLLGRGSCYRPIYTFVLASLCDLPVISP